VPALAATAAHVTMLQRSPTYIMPVPSRDTLNRRLRQLLGEERAYAVTRRKNIIRQSLGYRLSKRHPELVRRFVRRINAQHLKGSGVDIDVHFKPAYGPWDQRLCAVPDADLFKALRAGTASVVTDHIDTFTETGIRLRSGQELAADVIVTATGLDLLAFGGIDLHVDGRPVMLSETVAYKSLMLSGVPNFVFAVGYTNASWTLKVDLVCAYFCRLLAHADARGWDAAVAELPADGMALRPLLDFDAGYVLRSLDELPKQGDRAPWHLAMDYRRDTRYLLKGEVADSPMRFFRARAVPAAA
jgi:cation diffusion facilitator CzcD-associated flavoprotein CzcO